MSVDGLKEIFIDGLDERCRLGATSVGLISSILKSSGLMSSSSGGESGRGDFR
jgi:hypothetical protein